jgi:hypothetical protein
MWTSSHREWAKSAVPAGERIGSQEETCTMNSSLFNTLAALGEYFTWWQGVLLIALIVLIVFYWQYKKKQM